MTPSGVVPQDGVRGGIDDGAQSLELRGAGGHLLFQPGGQGEVLNDDQHLADQDERHSDLATVSRKALISSACGAANNTTAARIGA